MIVMRAIHLAILFLAVAAVILNDSRWLIPAMFGTWIVLAIYLKNLEVMAREIKRLRNER